MTARIRVVKNLSYSKCEDETVGTGEIPNNVTLTEQEIKEELHEMGVDVIEPESGKEEIMAEAFDAFSSFILEEEREKCQDILDNHINIGSSVGELQGGSDHHSIYRVLIPDDDCDDQDAATELLKAFYSSYQGKRYSSVLTIQKLKQYMLGMCDKHQRICEAEYLHTRAAPRKYVKLDNLMFILSFGPINGQVRHIDNMVPNLQICLYMSSECPSTIVYAMDGSPITNSKDLINHWGKNESSSQEYSHHVPALIKKMLSEKGDETLKSKWYTKYFAFWDSINTNLNCFGKLYQPVSLQLSLKTDPGTTLLAGGNEVHAGPPAQNARMFAFAIGILEDSEDDQDESEFKNEVNNGEVQYSPVLLHADLCCILFSIIDYEYVDEKNYAEEAKLFLLTVLLNLVKDFPMETYDRQIPDDRSEIRDWLGQILDALQEQDRSSIDKLVKKAVKSDTMFYSPDVKKRRIKKKKRRNAKSS